MGIVQRQGISSTVISYLGAALGFVNKILLFPMFLSLEQVGLSNALPVLAVMLAQFAALGMPSAILRFFPYFRDPEKQHHGFLPGFLLFSLVGFVVVATIFWVFKPQILSAWSASSPQLFQYSYLLIPFAFSYVLIQVFDAYLRSLYDIAFMTFIKEIGLRLPATIGVGLYALGLITFPTFINLYVGLVILAGIVPIFYTYFRGQLLVRPRFGEVWQAQFSPVFRYTLLTFLPVAGSTVLNQLDIFMLTFESEAQNGIYTTMAFATTVILIPWKALRGISSPLVAEHWKNDNLGEMNDLYQRTSLISLMVGTFVFLGLWLNRNNLVALLGEQYAQGLGVLLILGSAKVWDMTAGLNGTILITSKKYLYDMFFQVGLIGIGIGSNLILIPRYGILGAALATALSLFVINAARLVAVWWLFRLHPFHGNMFTILIGGLLTYYLLDVLPLMGHFMLDIPIRSLLCTALFVGLMLKWEVSPDVNDYVWKVGKKVGLGPLLGRILSRTEDAHDR